jgi:CHAT domain-containing protein
MTTNWLDVLDHLIWRCSAAEVPELLRRHPELASERAVSALLDAFWIAEGSRRNAFASQLRDKIGMVAEAAPKLDEFLWGRIAEAWISLSEHASVAECERAVAATRRRDVLINGGQTSRDSSRYLQMLAWAHYHARTGDRIPHLVAAIAAMQEAADASDPNSIYWISAEGFIGTCLAEIDDANAEIWDAQDHFEESTRRLENARGAVDTAEYPDLWAGWTLRLAQTLLTHGSQQSLNRSRAQELCEAVLGHLSEHEYPELFLVASRMRALARGFSGEAADLEQPGPSSGPLNMEEASWIYNRAVARLSAAGGDSAPSVAASLADFRVAIEAFKELGDFRQRANAVLGLAEATSMLRTGDPLINDGEALELLRGIESEVTTDDLGLWIGVQHALARHLLGLRPTSYDILAEGLYISQNLLERLQGPEREPRVWARVNCLIGDGLFAAAELGRQPEPGLLASAIGHLEEASDVARAAGLRYETVFAVSRLATVLRARDAAGDLERAIAAVRRLCPGASGSERGLLLDELGRCFALEAQRGRREWSEAVATLSEALDARSPHDFYGRYVCLQSLGGAQAYTGDWAGASDSFERAVDLLRGLWLSARTQRSRRALLDEVPGVMRRGTYVHMRAGRPELAAETLEFGRAREISDAMAQEFWSRDELSAKRPDLASTLDSAVADLRRVQRVPTQNSLDAEREFAAATDAVREAIAAIRSEPTFERFGEMPDVRAMAEMLADQEAISWIVATAWGTAVLTLLATGEVRGCHCDLTTQQLDDLLNTHNDAYLSSERSPAFPLALEKITNTLGEYVVCHLAETLISAGVERVILVPSGALAFAPLHAARYERAGRPTYLIDDVQVVYALSGQLHWLLLDRAESRNAWLPASVFGDTDIDSPLPFARIEAEVVAVALGVSPVVGEAVTSEAVKSSTAKAATVHFACHAESNPVEITASGIQLADGPLALPEIVADRLFDNARTVVLSACRTALVEISRVDEVTGLPSAIISTGVPNVVATLWSVDDLSTLLLAARMWTELGQNPAIPYGIAEAVRSAALWLRDADAASIESFAASSPPIARALEGVSNLFIDVGRGERPFSHPEYWAPFVCYGP